MPMVCPQCNGTFEQTLQCPLCGARLLYQAPTDRRGWLGLEEAWQRTPWGRVVVGMILAQGLYHGLRQLVMAAYLAINSGVQTGATVWTTLGGFILMQALQSIGVFSAGLLVGAGDRRGGIHGAVVGLWNGALFMAIDYYLGFFDRVNWSGDWFLDANIITLFEQPLLQAVVGALGGNIGRLIWPPLPAVGLTPSPSRPSSLPDLSAVMSPSAFEGPVVWVRVLIGTALAMLAIVSATSVLEFVLQASSGRVRIETQLHATMVTWEICGMGLLLGSLLAGANTRNGMKQGAWVGFLTATLLLLVRYTHWAVPGDLLKFTIISAGPLGLVGGWFGSQLLPPRMNRPRISTY